MIFPTCTYAHLLSKMRSLLIGHQDSGQIDILQVIRMSKNARDQGIPQTIVNWFRKAGFLSENSENMCDKESK